MKNILLALVALAALGGCGSQSYARSHQAGAAFTALVQGATREEPVLRVCVCDTDADCSRKCGGSY